MSAVKRSALGRGLSALIPGAHDPAPPPAAESGSLEIDVDRIDPIRDQPRRTFDPEQLERLAESIRQDGVLQPIVVRRNGDRFELLVGERCWRASQAAGRKTIPAVVADIAARDRLEVAIVENVQRHDLNPIELALAFQSLAEGGATQEQIGHRVGLDRSSVANHLRLLDLSRELQTDVETGRLSMGHAKALLQVANPERRHHLRQRILAEQLSVRAVEEAARPTNEARRAARPRASAPDVDPNLAHVVDQLRDRFKTRVRIVGDATRGHVELEYFSGPELDRLLNELLESR